MVAGHRSRNELPGQTGVVEGSETVQRCQSWTDSWITNLKSDGGKDLVSDNPECRILL